jgi:hypothetical protein
MSKMVKKISGVWTEQSTWSKIWKKTSGVWSQIYQRAYYLYKAGVQNILFTPTVASGTSIVFGASSIIMTATGKSEPSAGWKQCYITSAYVNTIEVPYKRMYIDFEFSASDVGNNYIVTIHFGAVQVIKNYNSSQARQIIEVDISSVSGLGAVTVNVQAYYESTGILTVHNISLEE